MDKETQIRLERWFDGEADPAESVEMEQLMESDPEAKAHLEGLQRMRRGLEASYQKPSRGADWSALQGQLEQPLPQRRLRLTGTARMGGIAALIVFSGMALWLPFRNASGPAETPELMVNSVEVVETDLEDAVPVVYLDQPSGWTVVWVLEETGSGEI